MKVRSRSGGRVRVISVELRSVSALVGRHPDDCINVGVDERLIELVQATPAELRALRRAGFRAIRDARRTGKR